MAQKLAANKPSANVHTAQSSLASFRQRRRPFYSSTEEKLGLRRFYVNGIPKTLYKEPKSHLYSLHFILTKIVDISYIANNCIEFIQGRLYFLLICWRIKLGEKDWRLFFIWRGASSARTFKFLARYVLITRSSAIVHLRSKNTNCWYYWNVKCHRKLEIVLSTHKTNHFGI